VSVGRLREGKKRREGLRASEKNSKVFKEHASKNPEKEGAKGKGLKGGPKAPTKTKKAAKTSGKNGQAVPLQGVLFV